MAGIDATSAGGASDTMVIRSGAPRGEPREDPVDDARAELAVNEAAGAAFTRVKRPES